MIYLPTYLLTYFLIGMQLISVERSKWILLYIIILSTIYSATFKPSLFNKKCKTNTISESLVLSDTPIQQVAVYVKLLRHRSITMS